jgi:hypothetical protein
VLQGTIGGSGCGFCLLARFGGLLLGLCRSLARDGSSWVCGCQTPGYSKADASSLSASQMSLTNETLSNLVSARSRTVCVHDAGLPMGHAGGCCCSCHSDVRPTRRTPLSTDSTASFDRSGTRPCVLFAFPPVSLAYRARSHIGRRFCPPRLQTMPARCALTLYALSAVHFVRCKLCALYALRAVRSALPHSRVANRLLGEQRLFG